MYDVDLQDAVPSARRVGVRGFGSARWPRGVNAGIIGRLHSRGKVAICYLDSGAWESYRPDAKLFPDSVIGRSTGWSGERWLDIRRSAWKRFAPIIWARLRLARSIGCDGVEPDENNPLGNHPGFPISKRAEARWYLKVAREAHARPLSVGMKNGVEVLDRRMARAFDWSLNEECFYYHECGRERPFIDAGKAVFQTEYVDDWRHRGLRSLGAVAGRVCPGAEAARLLDPGQAAGARRELRPLLDRARSRLRPAGPPLRRPWAASRSSKPRVRFRSMSLAGGKARCRRAAAMVAARVVGRARAALLALLSACACARRRGGGRRSQRRPRSCASRFLPTSSGSAPTRACRAPPSSPGCVAAASGPTGSRWGGARPRPNPSSFNWAAIRPAGRRSRRCRPHCPPDPLLDAALARGQPASSCRSTPRCSAASGRSSSSTRSAATGPTASFWATHRDLPYEPIHAWQIWNEENGVWFTEPGIRGELREAAEDLQQGLEGSRPEGEGGHRRSLRPARARPAAPSRPTTSSPSSTSSRGSSPPSTWSASTPTRWRRRTRCAPRSSRSARCMDSDGDSATPIWIDEFGWGSGNRYSFDKGPEGQKDELVSAYEMLITPPAAAGRSAGPTGSPGRTTRRRPATTARPRACSRRT